MFSGPCTAPQRLSEESAAVAGFWREFSHEGSNSVEWTGVNYSIRDAIILDSISGNVERGEMAIILGPSGAGKSSLLNILAGRMNTSRSGRRFSGTISMGGQIVDPVKIRSRIAYVMQEDALPALITPRELLHMSATLRLDKDHDGESIKEQVSQLIGALKLAKCGDTFVGNNLFKGISGGEKKRTSVAIELITKPQIIFLDEPLSGLDSYAAWTVVQVLKDLAAHGCAVICTVHQPSSEIFEVFDKVICLAEGRTVFCGSVGGLAGYMEACGHSVPANHNPADVILFHVQTLSLEDLDAFSRTWTQQDAYLVQPAIDRIRRQAAASAAAIPEAVPRKGFCTQLRCLLQREIRETRRNTIALVMRFVVNGFMGLFFASIFANVAKKDETRVGLQSHFGAMANLMIGTLFTSIQPLLLSFPFERPVFLREYAANLYGTIPYFLSKSMVEVVLMFFTSLLTWLCSYFIMGLQGNFLHLVLVTWALGLCAASLALVVGCNLADAKTVQEVAPLIFVPQMLFSGVFITMDLIPEWIRWMQYLCALKYAINIGCLIEFHGNPAYDVFLAHFDIERERWPFYAAMLFVLFLGFRLIAMASLKRKATFVF